MNSFEFDIKTDQSAIPREGNIKKNLQTHWISLKINSTNDVTLQNKYMHPLNSSLYYLILRVKWILSMHQKTQPPWFFYASLIVPGTCINYRTCSSMYTLFTRKLWLPYKKHQIAYIKWKIFFYIIIILYLLNTDNVVCLCLTFCELYTKSIKKPNLPGFKGKDIYWYEQIFGVCC